MANDVDSITNFFNRALEKVKKDVEKAFIDTADDIVNKAKSLAPVNTGNLRASIVYEKDKDGYTVGSTLNYALWVEFKTEGAKKSGDGTAKEAIYRWARLKGIENPYLVYRKIMRDGTKAHPFLIPAYNEMSTRLEKRVERAVQNGIK